MLVTHHHADHTAGVAALKSRHGARALGPAEDIPGLDQVLRGGECLALEPFGEARVLAAQGAFDVEVTASFSTANYPLVAENDAQFASGGSFSEVVQFSAANDADLVVMAVEGPTAIDSLIVKPGTATELADLAGTTIGVKGKLPPSVAAMLAQAGLVEGTDFDTVLLDGFDPVQHIATGPDRLGVRTSTVGP